MLNARRETFDRNARNVLPTGDLCNVSPPQWKVFSILCCLMTTEKTAHMLGQVQGRY